VDELDEDESPRDEPNEPPDERGAYLGAAAGARGVAAGAAEGATRGGAGGNVAGAAKARPAGVGSGVPVAGMPNPPRVTFDEPVRCTVGSDDTRTDEERTPTGGEAGNLPLSMCKVETRAGRVVT
jgi:hypothetical protein